MTASKDLVADASFYLCFLDDINKPDVLKIILKPFEAHVSRSVLTEVGSSTNYALIKDLLNCFPDAPFQLGEIVRPFFSSEEIKKGEHEIIVIAFVLHCTKKDIVIILDDLAPRKFIESRLPALKSSMVGTVGFVSNCYELYKTIKKDEALTILEAIKESKFRISKEIIEKVIQKIQGVKR